MAQMRGPSTVSVLAVQLLTLGAFGAAWATMSDDAHEELQELVSGETSYRPVKIGRNAPLVVTPQYDEPGGVSDEELAAVLKQMLPRFDSSKMKPNHIEHALRTWHANAEFQDPSAMSGADMRDFLIDHGRFMLSWGVDTPPLLEDRNTGVYIRWGHEAGASYHHDHTLACLTEALVPLNHPVRTPRRPNATMQDVVEQAMYDFQLDERETEWSAMAFGLWLPPTREWTNGNGRKLSFDLIARRQMRGGKKHGVCGGTHRVYSLMVLVRLHDRFVAETGDGILSDEVRTDAYAYLKSVRDILLVTQFEDGHWPYTWPTGEESMADDNPEYRNVIATGHHLEWLAIAPPDLHPPREMIEKAADWIIENTTSKTHEEIMDSYTFYSHVGNALALWRSTTASEFWMKWEAEHPWQPDPEKSDPAVDEAEPESNGEADRDEGSEDAEQPGDETAAPEPAE